MKNYTVIKTEEQHRQYVRVIRRLFENPTDENEDERELVMALIEKWEDETLKREEDSIDPIELLQWLMENHNLTATQLSKDLGITKGTMSKILNRKKGLSKHVIRKLAEKFKMRQEAFNREYELEADKPSRNKKTGKKINKKANKKVKSKKVGRKKVLA